MKGYEMETQTRIQAQDNRRIYVDHFDDGIWLSTHSEGFSCNLVLSKNQAKDLIAALIQLVDGDQK